MTEIEQELCDLFADLLEVDEVEVDDDFFDLGGHSLLAVELVARIRLYFGVSLKVRHFFLGPTVAQVAELVSDGSR